MMYMPTASPINRRNNRRYAKTITNERIGEGNGIRLDQNVIRIYIYLYTHTHTHEVKVKEWTNDRDRWLDDWWASVSNDKYNFVD